MLPCNLDARMHDACIATMSACSRDARSHDACTHVARKSETFPTKARNYPHESPKPETSPPTAQTPPARTMCAWWCMRTRMMHALTMRPAVKSKSSLLKPCHGRNQSIYLIYFLLFCLSAYGRCKPKHDAGAPRRSL